MANQSFGQPFITPGGPLPHLQTGIEWLDNLYLTGPVPHKTRHLTATINGDERDATWKQGVGIYVSGHDFGKGDTVEVEGTPHEVVEMRRMMMEGEAVSLIVNAREL